MEINNLKVYSFFCDKCNNIKHYQSEHELLVKAHCFSNVGRLSVRWIELTGLGTKCLIEWKKKGLHHINPYRSLVSLSMYMLRSTSVQLKCSYQLSSSYVLGIWRQISYHGTLIPLNTNAYSRIETWYLVSFSVSSILLSISSSAGSCLFLKLYSYKNIHT